MWKNLKDKALSGAMKVIQTDQAQKMMNSPEVQKAMFRAFQTSMKVKSDVSDTGRTLAKRLNFATNDDLQDLKRNIDRLERKVRDLKTENKDLKTKVADVTPKADAKAAKPAPKKTTRRKTKAADTDAKADTKES